MKKNFNRNLVSILIFINGLNFSTNLPAQVTIGSKGVPNQGALLDMKQEDKTDGSANSKKGLGLPRVALTAVDKLDPCVVSADDATKKKHIGLTVYNTTDNVLTDATLSEGVYTWDGLLWVKYAATLPISVENGLSLDGGKVILGGPLNRNTAIVGTNKLEFNTPTSVGNTFDVIGATTLTGNLTSNGTTILKNTNVTGNVSITGNETINGTLGVTGTTTTSATNVTGVMKYTNTTPTIGQYLSATNADGTVGWTTLPASATTEPWRIQGGASMATANTDNIYQMGNVSIGAGATASPYRLNVVGSTNVTGATTLASTLAVTGATTLTGNLTSSGTTALKGTNITGNLSVSGNTTTGSSTVTSNETVGGTLAVTGATTLTGNLTSNGTTALKNTNVTGNVSITGSETINGALEVTGTTTTKATNVTGVMKYTNTTPTIGQYLSATNADGTVGWTTLPASATTEPWRIQGGASMATANTDNIYQMGNVSIGAGATASPYRLNVVGSTNVTGATTLASTLAVTGATTLTGNLTSNGTTALKGTNITGNLSVSGNTTTGSSTVTSNETVGGTLAVTGATTLTGNLTSNGTTALKATNITGATTIGTTGSLTLAGNGAGAGRVLTSDAGGKGTWAVPVVNGAANGTQVVSNKVELGGTLTKGTTIAQGANSFAITSSNISTSSATFGTANAALNLTASNKGFMPPRVALKSATDNTTIPVTAADKGMTVYNIGTAFKEGLYTWSGAAWTELISQLPPATTVNMYYQTATTNMGLANGWNQSSMEPMVFSAQGVTHSPVSLKVSETGSYAINVKLYSTIKFTDGVFKQGNYVLYVGVWVNGVIADISEIFPSVITNVNSVSNVVLGFTANAGDTFEIRGGVYGYNSTINTGAPKITAVSKGAATATPNSVRTSMIYWKL